MEKEKRIVYSGIISSILILIGVHFVFGKDYVLQYFITFFLVSVVPMWGFIYWVFMVIYKYYYKHCIKNIFKNIDQEPDLKKIFGINKSNLIIDIIISLIIMISYFYFGINRIITLPREVRDNVWIYSLGLIPTIYGSHSGSIMIKMIWEAKSFLSKEINEQYIDIWFLEIRKLKQFLNIYIMNTYILCGLMYIAVLMGPHEDGIKAPLIIFLFFLILWPLTIHFFCRVYLMIIKEKIMDKKYSNLIEGNISIEVIDIEKDVQNRKNILKLFSGRNENFKNYSLVVSSIVSILQIVIIFYKN